MEKTLALDLGQRFHLREKLGEGGMGEVYLAEDTRLERQVAIKLVHHRRFEDSDARRLFHREARATAKLEHSGIVRIYDLLDHEDRDYIVMEHLRGQTLDARLRESVLPTEEILPIFQDIASSLAHAHENGIVHRDLKPGNIWITREEKVKLLDFGLAKQIETDESSLFQDQIVGTVDYMSPEQACGKKLDSRSDLFSLGVVLYQALTGEMPFRGKTLAESLANTITKQHIPAAERNPEVPRRISDLIDRLLEKDLEHRPGNASEVIEALKNIDSPAEPPPSIKNRLAAMAVAAILVVSSIVFLTSEDPQRPSVAVLGSTTGPQNIEWTATAMVEILNLHLQTGGEWRVIDGLRTVLVPTPKNAGEKLDDDELARLGKQLRVDHLVLGQITGDDAEFAIHLGLYRMNNGERVAEISTIAQPTELADALADAAARLRQQLGATPLDPELENAVRAAFPPGDAGELYAKGLKALREYKPNDAARDLRFAVEKAPLHPMPLSALVRAQVELGEFGLGIENAEKALELGGSLPDRQQHELAAMVAEASQDWPTAADRLDLLWRQHPEDLSVGIDLIDALLALEEVDEARNVLAALGPISLTLVDDGYLDLAAAHAAFLVGDFSVTRQAASRAGKTSTATGAKQLGAKAHLLEAMALGATGDHRAARKAIQEAERKYMLLNNRSGFFDTFNLHVVTLARQGQIAEAQELFDLHHEVYSEQRADRQYEAVMAASLGNILIDQGDLESATRWLKEAAATYEAIGQPGDAAIATLSLGVAEQLLGKLASARTHYQNTCDTFEDLGDRANLAYALTNLGELHFWANELADALNFHHRALKINREIESPAGVAWDTFRIAETLRRKGDVDDLETASDYYEEALDLEESLVTTGEMLTGLAWLEIQRKNFGNALKHARTAARTLREAGLCDAPEEQGEGKRDDPRHCLVDLVVLAQLAEAEALLADRVPDLAEARKLITVARLHSTSTQHRRLQLTTRLAAARLAVREGQINTACEALKNLAEDALADGFVLIAEDAQELLGAV